MRNIYYLHFAPLIHLPILDMIYNRFDRVYFFYQIDSQGLC